MRLGIFAKTFGRPTVGQTLQAAADAGLTAVQFNLSVLGLPTVPGTVPPEAITATREAAARAGVGLAAISGTFNTAHPDPAVRQAGVARFPVLCQAAAASHGITLAVEPEHANVLATAALARRMLDEIGSPALGIVFDAANLIDPDTAMPQSMQTVITGAITLLGPDIVLAHAKELTARRRPVPAGAGIMPWAAIIDALHRVGFGGTVVIHGLDEADVPRAVLTVRDAMARTQGR